MQIGYNPIFISGHVCVILMTMSIYPPLNQYTCLGWKKNEKEHSITILGYKYQCGNAI